MTTPDDCPFHDLDPAVTVWIDNGSTTNPYSAELACADYHLGQALGAWIDARLVEMSPQTEEQQ